MNGSINTLNNVERRIDRLARTFFQLSPAEERIALAIYRLLCGGKPVAPADIARHAGQAVTDVIAAFDRWPGIYQDSDRNVIGFWGLSFEPVSDHQIVVSGQTMYAWCAWDTLFIPILLNKACTVKSRCKATGKTLEFEVSPSGVAGSELSPECLSFLTPDNKAIETNVVGNFCHYVHFFRDRAAADDWATSNPPCFALSLEDAIEAARRKVQFEYGGRIVTGKH